MEIVIILVILLLPVFGYISIYNTIKTYGIKVEESFSNIDVALAKRYEVITKLFEIAKGYAKHEKETLVKVIQVRNGMTLNEKETAYTDIEREYTRFNILSEGYPELKADALFLNLQNAVMDTENHLAAARRLYNSSVSYFNQKIQTFPGNLVASQLNEKSKPMLEFKKEQIQDVKLDW